jgi:hypothetical protein
MITEMFIEGQQVDVSEYLSTLITYAIDDIKDFSSRNTSFSKTIVLPGTARNNKIFGNIFEMESANPYDDALPNVLTNFNAAKSAGCYIFQDNIQVFKGVVRLLEIIVDRGRKEYEVAVFGELGGFVSALGNKKLEDLDFSAHNHNYTLANITASWDNYNAGSGYYYPLIDYGNYSAGKHDWDYKTFRPALFIKEYIDKIFAATQYTYNCALFGTTRFKSLIVPHNQARLRGASPTLATLTIPSQPSIIVTGGAFLGYVDFSAIAAADFTIVSGERVTYNGSSPTIGDIIINLKGTYYSSTSDVQIRIESSVSGTIAFGWLLATTGSTTAVPFDFSFSATNHNFTTGEYFVVSFLSNEDNYQVDVSNTSTLKIIAASGQNAELNLGNPVEMSAVIPRNILQKDFFASILKLFNLYVTEDRDAEFKLNITPYIDYYDVDPGDAIDWSGKLNRDKPIRIKPLSELNSRYYEFKFKQDSDFYNEEYRKRYNQSYGDRIYDSEFEFAQESNTAEVIFSGTVLVGYQSEDKVYSTIFKKSGTTEEQIDTNIRILQAKKITGASTWSIKNGATVLGSYTAYGYAGHFDDPNAPGNDIQFGVPKELFFTLATGALNVNQFNVYWSSYMAEITDKDSRLLTASFRLNARDIYNLDFSKMVYLDGNLYRLNKIEDYNASREDECTVTLLKVIQTLY